MTPIFARQTDSERAFERLYQAHVQDVYRYALMVLRNRADAEDVAQTTFMKAYRAIRNGERPRSPRAWLIAIAHNTCRTRLRDASRRPQEVELDERLAAAVERDERHGIDPKELMRALGELSFNQRSALVMRELEGRSYVEIATALEITPSAVETLLFRARRALREQLEGVLTCGEAELSLSRDLDGRLPKAEKSHLRAHLRTCAECASLARRQRARRAALRSLGPLPLPGSLAGWGGGAAAGTGLAAKVAAVVAAGAAAAGAAYEAEAVRPTSAHGERSVAVAAPRAEVPAELAAVRLVATRRSVVGHASTASRHTLPQDDAAAPENEAAGSSRAKGSSAADAAAPPVAAGEPATEVRVTAATLEVRVPATSPRPGGLPPAPQLPVSTPQLPPAPAVEPPPLPSAPAGVQLP